jgi:hypothetical protein
MKAHYTARWAQPGHPSIGNVSFFAASDSAAKRKADRIAHEIGLPNTPRTLSRGAECIEVLDTGTTNNDR